MTPDEARARFSTWFRSLAARGALVLTGDPGRTYSVPGGLEAVAAYDAPAVAGVEGRPVLKTWVERVGP